MDTAWTLATMVAGVEVIVLFHIFGHFLLAKLLRVPMDIRLGFGPAIPGCRFSRRQTTLVLAVFPLGGYTKVPLPAQKDAEVPAIWKRLCVSLGGVAMNVVLAWICISLWLYHGAEQISPVIGQIDIGSPAWIKGLPTGSVIQEIGSVRNPSFADIIAQVMGTKENEKLGMVYSIPGDPNKVSLEIVPRLGLNGTKPFLGVVPSFSPRLISQKDTGGRVTRPVFSKSAAERAVPPFAFDDVIIATTDPANPDRVEPLPEDPRNLGSGNGDFFEWSRRLRLLAGKEITVQVHRADGREDKILVPPAFHATFGMRMAIGPVSSVRERSPGERAGIKITEYTKQINGDLILAVEIKEPDGRLTIFDERNLDPLRLPYELRQWSLRMTKAGKVGERNVTLKVGRHQVERKNELDLLTLQIPWDSSWENQNDGCLGRDSLVSIPELGIAYQVTSRVAGFEPMNKGLPGDSLEPEDTIVAVQFPGDKSQYFLDAQGWVWAFNQIQRLENKDITVEIMRQGRPRSLFLKALEDPTWPMEDRGLILVQDTRLEKPGNLLDAFGLGLRYLGKAIDQLIGMLRNYVVGRIAPTVLAGPVAISRVGYRLADRDLFQFIYFLGLLSLNFSLFNLFPIPILDGGELLLLICEKIKGQPFASTTRFIAYCLGLTLLTGCLLLNVVIDLFR